jgi:hypothetical protein
MTGPILARVRGNAAAEDEEPMDPADPWTSVYRMFKSIFARFDADDARFAALEARRAAAHGRDGADAVGIVNASINGVGHLVIQFSDGVVKDVGQVVGRDAPPAPAPQSLEFQRDDTGRIIKSILR